MKIYIQMKAAGKRKPVLDPVPYELPDHVSTLREFLTELVRMEWNVTMKREKTCR